MRTMLAVAAVAVCAAALTAQDKKQYEIDGRFSAKFPNGPTVTTKTAGGLTLNIFMSEYDKGKGGLMVVYSDVPGEKLKAPTPEQVLISCRDALEKEFMLKLPRKDDKIDADKVFVVKDAKYPTMKVEGDKGEFNLKGSIILVDKRLYQVYAVGPKTFVDGDEAKAFFESFKIDEAPPKK